MRPQPSCSDPGREQNSQGSSLNRPVLRRTLRVSLRILLPALLTLGMLCLPGAPRALILDASDETGNTTPPEDDPGWRNVGHHLETPTVVYLGNQWILTTEHAGLSAVILEGKRYDPVPGSLLQVQKPKAEFADLLLFRIDEDPGLPSLSMATASPIVGERVLLIASGTSRGERFSAYPKGSEPLDGFTWESDQTRRWGTNRVEAPPRLLPHRETNTMAFPMAFDRIEEPGGTRYEAAGALGDSGGALFSHKDPRDPNSDWVLSGIIFSVTSRGSGLQRITFYNDLTWAADLSYYRDQIMKHMREYEAQSLPHELPPMDPEPRPSGLIMPSGVIMVLLLVVVAWLRIRRTRSASQIDR